MLNFREQAEISVISNVIWISDDNKENGIKNHKNIFYVHPNQWVFFSLYALLSSMP